MGEHQDYRDVLSRAAEGGSFDDLIALAVAGHARNAGDWRAAILARAQEIAGDPPEGERLDFFTFRNRANKLIPEFLLVPA